MAQVEIGLRAVVGDVHLAVLERRHGARIHVDVGIEFLDRHPEAALHQEATQRGRRDALAERRHDAAGHEDVLRRTHGLTSLSWRLSCASAYRRSSAVSTPGAAGPGNSATPIGSPFCTRATAPCSAAGATSGSSPCTFSTTSYELNDLLPTTSATRSVPDSWSAEVSTASNPARSTTATISRASVATTRRSHTPVSTTRRTTQRMRGSPAKDRSGLRGRRLEPSRAGTTPRTGTGEHTKSVPWRLALDLNG